MNFLIVLLSQENNLLRHGLSCRIDSIKVIPSEDDADVICTLTITNHDNCAYYIPDVNKMGEEYFTDYTGGLHFTNIETGLNSFFKTSNSNRQRDDIRFSDLSLLNANSKVSYSYKSLYYHAMPEGEYNVRLSFMGIVYTAKKFELKRDNGRIWVGEVSANTQIKIE